MNDLAKVIVVDDHHFFRKGIILSIEGFPFAEVIGEASNGQELLKLLEKRHPDIILMDIKMPEMNGIEATHKALLINPNLKIIVMTAFKEDEHLDGVFDSGAKGLMLKDITSPDLEYALKTVINGGNWFSPEVLSYFTRKQRDMKSSPRITKRETEVLQLVAEGLSNQKIADKLCISLRTITNHRANMHKKIGVNNTIHLLSWGIKHNIIKNLN